MGGFLEIVGIFNLTVSADTLMKRIIDHKKENGVKKIKRDIIQDG